MPWFLSTDRAELHFFSSLDKLSTGYATLSHTWGEDEQTFEEIQSLREDCKKTGENPRDKVTQKIRRCCILAEAHGCEWLWVDTCCIDKKSSADLSEGINSMFILYGQSEVCYAYLEDVEDDCVVGATDSAFRTACWHWRGWTLQELIAPMIVVFVSKNWKTIGTKADLAPLLEEVTGIPRQVLTHEVCYSKIAVAERMSWAAKRRTTRLEDEAYCLMGIFNVNMAIIYGEGSRAFQRLQQEIMKQGIDASLFAWGSCVVPSNSITPMDLQDIHESFATSSHPHAYLLAHSPNCFTKPFGWRVCYTPCAIHPLQPYFDRQRNMIPEESKSDIPVEITRGPLGPFGRMELPIFSPTGYGLDCRFPIIESDGFTVAVLLCDTGREHLGLLLHPSNNPVQDPSHKAYHTGHGFRAPSGPPILARLVSLGSDFYNLRLNGKRVTAEWRNIIIADVPPPVKEYPALIRCSSLHSISPAPPFRFSPRLISNLMRLGMELHPLHIESKPIDGKPLLLSASFEDVIQGEGIFLVLGTCTRSPDGMGHWAKAAPLTRYFACRAPVKMSFIHDCDKDHVVTWPCLKKDFGDNRRTIHLSFSRCQHTPGEHTLVANIELRGNVYAAMRERRCVEFPSREDHVTLVIGMPLEVIESTVPLLPEKEQVSFQGSKPQAPRVAS